MVPLNCQSELLLQEIAQRLRAKNKPQTLSVLCTAAKPTRSAMFHKRTCRFSECSLAQAAISYLDFGANEME